MLYFSVALTPEICATLCTKTAHFRGYSVDQNLYCYCWYEDGQVPPADSSSGVTIYDGHSGSGEITQILYTGYSTCYQFVPQ